MVFSLSSLYLGLVHYPVLRNNQIITSSITNFDIHDIARISKTYGLAGYYLIHPEEKQRSLAATIAGHWLHGAGKTYNPDRADALETISIVPSLETAVNAITRDTGKNPTVIGTSARLISPSKSLSELNFSTISPSLLLFGTAGGLATQHINLIDFYIDPIDIGTTYNHLSVRSAVAIFIDRLHFLSRMHP